MYLYNELLDPDLYDDAFVATFIETLNEPEIQSNSMINVEILKNDMMAMDDIQEISNKLIAEAQDQTTTTGTLSPQFTIFRGKNNKIRFNLETGIPIKQKQIQQFLSAGKALALARQAQCIFFSTMQPLANNKPAYGDKVNDESPWGIFVIGSSLRGNCFIQLHQIIRNINSIRFQPIHQKIVREGEYASYPFSKFYDIQDNEEMSRIVQQIPKIIMKSNISERECVINFATTLRALQCFGYS